MANENHINQLCPEGTACAPRVGTDTLFELPAGAFEYSGLFDKSIRLIERIQLLDRNMWDIFVKQFSFNPDDADKGWRCEYWGKMMRGACFTYKYTGNPELYNTLENSVRSMLKKQDALGRFSTYSIPLEFNGWDIWGRKYVLLGFQYFCEICPDKNLKEKIIAAMCAHADYIIEKIGRAEDGKKPITEASSHWKGLNSSSILEPYVRLYNMTGKQKYLDFAAYIIDNGGISEGNIFELAYEGKLYPYQYPVTKAYEMMSCFEGLLEYYRVVKEPRHLTAVRNFVDLVIKSDITIIGCAGCTHELFDNSVIRQTNTEYQGVIQETCVTVTWMKLCYQLLCLDGDPKLADQIELSVYNALPGSINTNGCTSNSGLPFDSYSPLLPNKRGRKVGGYKVMEDGKYFYGCCAAIGAAGTGLMALSSVMAARDGVCFNLYPEGRVKAKTPEGQDLLVKIKTEYPVSDTVDFEIDLEKEEEFAIYLRIPEWSKNSLAAVNGGNISGVSGGEYLKIVRTWSDKDTITLRLDLSAHLINSFSWVADPATVRHVALKRGPVILARDARFGEDIREAVDIKADGDGCVELTKSNDAAFDTLMEFIVPLNNGKQFHVVDYLSAGKTWDMDSEMAAWFQAVN
ncbi:MAG: glycoside hydrolase family 127 protein [Eubacteriales bacterium]|nr:glycoside hydrolase family 127 protein [Eubacteriales bacterium]